MRPLMFAALALIGASGSVLAMPGDDDLQQWVRLDTEIQRATQALASDADGARPSVVAMLKRVDAINNAWDTNRDESTSSRAKRNALRGPLYNLRLALEQPALASRIAIKVAKPQGPLMSAEGVGGTSCEQAIELVPGHPMRIEIPSKASRWIAMRSPINATAPLAITTVGSDIDAVVDVFADCRDISKKALSSGDDNYGLQAIALLPIATHPLMVELSNAGERGIATVNVITAVTISGRITRSDTGAPIAGMSVHAYQGLSPPVAQIAGITSSQENGGYQLTTFATYGPNTYVRTAGAAGQNQFVDRAWVDIACSLPGGGMSGCGPGGPTIVTAEDGVAVSGIDLALSPGGTIIGQVTDRAGTPVHNALISLTTVGAPPSSARTTRTDFLGRYSISALANGQYRILASATGYKSQVFRGLDCDIDCVQIAGTPVSAIEFGQSSANFSLSRSNNIRVSLTVDGQLHDSFAHLSAINAAGTTVAETNTAGNFGSVLILGPLPAGSYRVRAEGLGLVSEYYQDIICPDTCGPAELQAATPILVSNDAPPVDIAMDLSRAPELGGLVTDTSGVPIANVFMSLIGAGASFQTSTATGNDGTYRIRAPNLGRFLLRASSPGHVDEAYDNVPCEFAADINACPGATLIQFAAGMPPPPANFELAPSSIVRGNATNLTRGQSFAVYALNDLNQTIGRGLFTRQSDGSYQLYDLPPGAFRFGFIPDNTGRIQIFDHIDCGNQTFSFTQCPTMGPTSVNLVSGSIVKGIDFTYRTRNGRLGLVTDEATSAPLPGIIIDAFNAQSGARFGSVVTDRDGRFDIAPNFGNPGSYVLATDNSLGYVNEVYNNMECTVGSVYLGTCPLTGATPIAFPGDGSDILITLRREDMLFRSGFD